MERQLMRFYVYVLGRGPEALPFYVGKGTGDRFRQHRWDKSNSHKASIIQKEGNYSVVFVGFFVLEQSALECEVETIAELRKSFKLTNITDGGVTGFNSETWARSAKKLKLVLGSGINRERLVRQAREMSRDPRVLSSRSRNLTELQATEAFEEVRKRSVRERYRLRAQALELLKLRPIPEGFVLPDNMRTGGTLLFWRSLYQELK